MVVAGVPLLQCALRWWTRHGDRPRAMGWRRGGGMPVDGPQPTGPASRIGWPTPLRTRHTPIHAARYAVLRCGHPLRLAIGLRMMRSGR